VWAGCGGMGWAACLLATSTSPAFAAGAVSKTRRCRSHGLLSSIVLGNAVPGTFKDRTASHDCDETAVIAIVMIRLAWGDSNPPCEPRVLPAHEHQTLPEGKVREVPGHERIIIVHSHCERFSSGSLSVAEGRACV
jgi:hypothetical protein